MSKKSEIEAKYKARRQPAKTNRKTTGSKAQESMDPKKRTKIKIILLIVELLVLVGLVIWWFNSDLNPLNKIQKVEPLAPREELVNEDIKEETAQTLEGYLDIAIFGVDNRSNGDYNSGNSDVIMICSINKDTKEIKLVSVYRDTFCDTDVGYDTGINFHKINRAYAFGGPQQSIKVLNANLDLDIEHFITVDFNAVTDIVNCVDGIDVELTEKEVERINHNIKTTGKITGKYSDLIDDPGMNHLNGTQAAAYCRIRHTTGSDYRRTQRQRTVLAKVFEKVKKADPATINNIVNTVFPEISTDMTNFDIIALIADIANYDFSKTCGFPFIRYSENFGGNKGDVVCAADWTTNTIELHKFLYNNQEYEPSETVALYNRLLTENYGITIDKAENKTQFEESGIQFDNFDADKNIQQAPTS